MLYLRRGGTATGRDAEKGKGMERKGEGRKEKGREGRGGRRKVVPVRAWLLPVVEDAD